MAEEVAVYGLRRCPSSDRVEVARKLIGVQYELNEEDPFNKSPSLLKYNPVHKKMPVLVHNEKLIVGSDFILENIDETWKGNPILPQDPCERAKARFWVKTIDDKCSPAIWNASLGPEDGRDKAVEEAREQLRIVENEPKDKKCFGGGTIGMVDIGACASGVLSTSGAYPYPSGIPSTSNGGAYPLPYPCPYPSGIPSTSNAGAYPYPSGPYNMHQPVNDAQEGDVSNWKKVKKAGKALAKVAMKLAFGLIIYPFIGTADVLDVSDIN